MRVLAALEQRLLHAVLTPVLERNERMLQRQEDALRLNKRVLEQVTSAVSECAVQLANHNEAVRGMAEASQELREAVREMNRILGKSILS